MASAPFGVAPVVTLDGKELPAWAPTLLERTVVEDHVHLPDTVALTFRDPGRDVLPRLGVKPGTRVVVSAAPAGDTARQPLITAEVTGLERVSGPSGNHVTVLAYDLSHRLCRGRRTRSWNDVTDASIAQELATSAGLKVEAEATPLVHRHVSQVAISDWEFLKGRAQETGFEVAVVGETLHWRRPADHAEAPAKGELGSTDRKQLVFGEDLLRFAPRVTSAGQVTEVEARGWDPVGKRSLSARATAHTTSAAVGLTLDELVGQLPGEPVLPVVHRALSQQAEVDAAAAAAAEVVASAHAEATGEAKGDPELCAGAAVSVSLVGWPHDGTWTLTTTRHVFDATGYRTTFTCSGRQERSVLGLATLGATKGTTSAAGAPVYGVVVGVVSDNKDPEGLSRVRLVLPWLSEDYLTPWARVTQLGAGSDRGAAFLPEVGDEVLVAFDRGDTRVPYVVGQLWNGKDRSPHAGGLVDSAGKVARRVVRSRTGHELLLDEDRGIRISTSDEGYTLELGQQDRAVTLHSDGTVTLTGGGTVLVKGGADVQVEAATSLVLKGGTAVDISAPTISVTASASLDLDGGAAASLKAGLVRIN